MIYQSIEYNIQLFRIQNGINWTKLYYSLISAIILQILNCDIQKKTF